jgi:hypothetical protein
MSFIGDFKSGFNAILHPAQNTGKKMSIGDSLKMYYMFSIVPVVLFIVLGAIVAFLASSVLSLVPGLGAVGVGLGGLAIVFLVIIAIVEFWIAVPISLLIQAALYQLVGGVILKWFKNGYSATLTASVYSTMAVIGVIWLFVIPIIGALIIGIFGLWSIYVFVTALANQHGITKGKAFAVWAIWLIIGIIIFAVIGFSSLAALSGLGLGGVSGGVPGGYSTYTIPTIPTYTTPP